MNLPEYPHADTSNYYWNLYTNSYYPWKTQCDSYSGIDMEFMIEQVERSSTVASTQFSAMVTSIALLVIVVILVLVSVTYKNADFSYDAFKEQKLVDFIIGGIEIVISTLIAYFFSSCTSTINGYNESVQRLSSSKCSDDFSNRIFTSYAQTLVSKKAYLILA